jgi:hypothetical protein
VSFKYLARVFALALLLAECTPVSGVPTASPTVASSPSPSVVARPAAAIAARLSGDGRRWFLTSDAVTPSAAALCEVVVRFAADATAAAPVARLRGAGTETALTRVGDVYRGTVDLHGLAPGPYDIDVVERTASGDAVVATRSVVVSAPEYVVWTLDFEGDAAGDAEMANTGAIADKAKVPMTIMWNPRAWTTAQVSAARAEAMLAWTKQRATLGDEVSLHLHMWTDFVRAAGVAPRAAPSWAGRSDGYDVPMTAFSEAETRTLLEYALGLMVDHGLPRATTFRAGGQFANAANLRALSASGFVADASAVAAGEFGRLRLPWTLGADAQPYHPDADDANRTGTLPILEAPTIGGNTYGYDTSTIKPIIRADLSYLAAAGEIAKERRAITIVSHPGTIDPTERAAIESLLAAFEPLRYDRDAGPLRFVTLAQLAQAYGN